MYTTLAFLALLGALYIYIYIYIYDISSIRVNTVARTRAKRMAGYFFVAHPVLRALQTNTTRFH